MQPLASSGTFITFITAGLFGGFGALVALALKAPGLVVAIVAAICGVAFIGYSVGLGLRQYRQIKRTVLFPMEDVQ